MKRLISLLVLFVTFFAGHAQQKNDPATTTKPGGWQLAAFGGLSMPQGTYRHYIGRANDGPLGGLSLDYYFPGSRWAFGADARFLQHGMRRHDTVFMANGYIATDYANALRFRHIATTVGPAYKAPIGRFEVEAFLRGGLVFQQFPQYTQSVYLNPAAPGPGIKVFDNYYTNNPKNNPKAWVGIGGLRLGYNITPNLGVFVQADYLNTFGSSFPKDSGEFHVQRYGFVKEIDATDGIKMEGDRFANRLDFFEETVTNWKTHTQAINIAAGVKYTFGRRSRPAPSEPKPIPVPVPNRAPSKEILVVVKDKQTGIALSGVTVAIKKGDDEFISVTNANGEADRVKEAAKGAYVITGVKNGIQAAPESIAADEFERGGPVIYKEIYHDDPRFTLIGETIQAGSGTKMPGINTVLTHTGNNSNNSQLSDAEAKFVYQLEQQSDYSVVASHAGKFSQTETVTTKGLDRSKTLYVTLKLGVSELETGASFVLKNIHYDFDKADIRPDAARILDNVVNVLHQNPSLKIELSSHTDSRGSDSYNLSLSQRRAEAAVNYLISRGIDRNRLRARGYGEMKLLNRCANGVNCTEEEHQANRRTEIEVLAYGD